MGKFGRDAAVITEPRIARWKPLIQVEARCAGLQPSIVAAIISRETAGLDDYCQPPPAGKLGDGGHGCGPMQIDDRSSTLWCADWKAGKLTLQDGIHMGCQILAGKLKTIDRIIPALPQGQHLRAAIAAYNCGEGNVRRAFRSGADLDQSTAWGNYSADVLERAAYFASLGYDN